MLDLYGNFIAGVSNVMYTYVLIILLVGGGIYFTLRTKGVQLKYLVESIRLIMEPAEDQDSQSLSSFQALMVSTASRVGTGNIAGVSTAICIGGPGAVFWMWVTALFGTATAFLEGTLAQIYKRRAEDGTCYGGPAYYIEGALNKRWLGVVYAVLMILTYMIGFNLVAAFNVADAFKVYSFYDASITPIIVGAIHAVIFGICICGGGKKISQIASFLVPIMGALYIGAALIMMVMNINLLPGVIASIFKSAFDFEAIFGGFTGSVVMMGIKRGLFSNEAGVGAAATAAGSASVSHPVKSGLVQVLSVFIDTIVVCSATSFLLLCSGVEPTAEAAGMSFVQAAVGNVFGQFGIVFITVALVLFAFTTVIGNYFYTETGMVYLLGHLPSKAVKYTQRAIAIVVVFVGSLLSLGVAWDTADVFMGLMAIINIPVLVILAKPALLALKDYIKQKKEGKNPVFKAADIGLEQKTDFWN